VNGFLIDTNVLSEFARRQPADARVDRWLKTANEESLFVSVLTMAEIRRGVELLPAGKRRFELEAWYVALQVSFADRLLPVTMPIGDRWAKLSAQAQRRGTPLAILDGFIGATALEHELTVVTRNVRDFAAMDVVVLNPWKAGG
jgi:predicted nucleic acid-binding protein